MSRLVAVGDLLQAAIFAGLALWLGPKWPPAAGLAGAAAALQLVAAVFVLLGKPRLVRALAAASLLLGLLVVGFFVQAAVHAMTAYGPDAARQGQLALLGVLAALPWVAFFPAWQWLQGRSPGADATRGLGAVVLAVGLAGLPAVARALTTAPVETWAPVSPEAGQELAEAAFAAWVTGAPLSASLPAGKVLLTPWTEGKPGTTVHSEAADLAAAVQAALSALPPAGDRAALVLDIVVERWPAGTAMSPSRAAVEGGPSPVSMVQARKPSATTRPLPEWRLASVRGEGPVLRVDSYLAQADGSTALVNGWAPAPQLSADAVLQATIDAGDMLLEHQQASGRYAYTVEGPEGTLGRGYNFPRHAGATWFLARLSARTGLARFADGADRGLAYLAEATTVLPDGRGYVMDPRREDGRAWAGTTALAALAAVERQHPMTEPWGQFLAGSVDDRGAVRGEIVIETGVHPDQPVNPYGQGQTTLALAALVRAGHDDLRPAMQRAADFMDGAYAPAAAGRLLVLDEHWTCLSASAIHDVTGTASGLEVCEAYLAQSAVSTPVSGDPLAISAGSGGGLAEAVVGGAFLAPDGPHRDRALAFGQHFLDSQYRDQDAPLLPKPDALIGGFRDSPWKLDVRVDAVQHIGCALLGIEELLRGERLPGSRP